MPCRRACRPPWKVASRDSQQPAVEDDCASIQFCPTSRGILSGESPAHAREPGRSSPPKREETLFTALLGRDRRPAASSCLGRRPSASREGRLTPAYAAQCGSVAAGRASLLVRTALDRS